MRGIVFDVETTGLPRGGDWKKKAHFNSCRLVSIGWEVIDMDAKKTIEKNHFYIKPKDFVIPDRAIDVHGITNEMARQMGDNVNIILQEFLNTIKKHDVACLIAHNISFDMNVLCSELYRLGYLNNLNKVLQLKQVCTMKEGKKHMKLKKNPKLCDLYKLLTKEEMGKQHCAEADTRACAECFFNLKI